MHPKLKSFFAGTLIAAAIGAASIWGTNEKWERAAYEHAAGFYTFNIRHPWFTTFHWYN